MSSGFITSIPTTGEQHKLAQLSIQMLETKVGHHVSDETPNYSYLGNVSFLGKYVKLIKHKIWKTFKKCFEDNLLNQILNVATINKPRTAKVGAISKAQNCKRGTHWVL